MRARPLLTSRMTGGKKVSSTYLYNLYKARKIKFKAVIRRKTKGGKGILINPALIDGVKKEVATAVAEERVVIFCDECMFTHATMPKLAFACMGDNVVVDPNHGNSAATALIAGISAEHGLVHFLMYDRSVNTDGFLEFLENVTGSLGDQKIAVFMDNLNVHRSKRAKAFMEENDVRAIYNVPYSPEYNPIEVYFGHIKRPYRQMKLEKMVNKEKFDARKLIMEAIETRSQESVRRVA